MKSEEFDAEFQRRLRALDAVAQEGDVIRAWPDVLFHSDQPYDADVDFGIYNTTRDAFVRGYERRGRQFEDFWQDILAVED